MVFDLLLGVANKRAVKSYIKELQKFVSILKELPPPMIGLVVISAMIFGNFNDLVVGEWGSLDVIFDPYTNSTTGAMRITVFLDIDVAVRHAESFAAIQDMVTT